MSKTIATSLAEVATADEVELCVRRRMPHALAVVNATAAVVFAAGQFARASSPLVLVGGAAGLLLAGLSVPTGIALAQRTTVGPPSRVLVVRAAAPQNQRQSALGAMLEIDGTTWPRDAVRGVGVTEELRRTRGGPAPSVYRVDLFVEGRGIVRVYRSYDGEAANALVKEFAARLECPILPRNAEVMRIAPHMSLWRASMMAVMVLLAPLVAISISASTPARPGLGDVPGVFLATALFALFVIGLPWLLARAPYRTLMNIEFAERAPPGESERPLPVFQSNVDPADDAAKSLTGVRVGVDTNGDARRPDEPEADAAPSARASTGHRS